MDPVISLDAKRKKVKAKAPVQEVDRVAIKAKASFEAMMQSGLSLSQEDFRDYVMLVFADMSVYLLNAQYFEDTPKALKRGIDILNLEYGPNGTKSK